METSFHQMHLLLLKLALMRIFKCISVTASNIGVETKHRRLVGAVVTTSQLDRCERPGVRFTDRPSRTQCRQRLAIAATSPVTPHTLQRNIAIKMKIQLFWFETKL